MTERISISPLRSGGVITFDGHQILDFRVNDNRVEFEGTHGPWATSGTTYLTSGAGVAPASLRFVVEIPRGVEAEAPDTLKLRNDNRESYSLVWNGIDVIAFTLDDGCLVVQDTVGEPGPFRVFTEEGLVQIDGGVGFSIIKVEKKDLVLKNLTPDQYEHIMNLIEDYGELPGVQIE